MLNSVVSTDCSWVAIVSVAFESSAVVAQLYEQGEVWGVTVLVVGALSVAERRPGHGIIAVAQWF